eukprot:4624066-Lingulodinium_polyedra.AAC.1
MGADVWVVLRPGGSAAGTDGFPYEVYQFAPLTQACIIAQAVMYAPWGTRIVNCIIGGEPELLVFIPKAGAAIDVHRVLE